MKNHFLFLCVILVYGYVPRLIAQTPDNLTPQVFSTSGDFFTNTTDSISLSFTIGELLTQTSITNNGRLILTQGFQQPEDQDLVGIFVPDPLIVDYEVFPNPTPGELILKLQGKEPTTLFAAIFDLRGRRTVVPEQKLGFIGRLETIFDLAPLPEGNYFLRLYDENRTLVETIKVQKAHR